MIGVDFLYVQPQATGVPITISETRTKNPDMKWGYGFRVSFGYTLPRDNWGLQLIWLSVPVQNHTDVSGHLLPTWTSAEGDSSSFVDSAKSRWRLHLGLVDLDLSKPWRISPSFILYPHGGIRFASIRQKFYITYSGGSLFPGDSSNFASKNKYWGLGPEGGLTLEYLLNKHWSMRAGTAFSLVFGGFYIHETEREEKSRIEHLKLLSEYPMSAALLDMTLGLRYSSNHWSFHLDWEEHLFPGQNQLNFPVNTSPKKFASNLGAVSIAGISLGAVYHF